MTRKPWTTPEQHTYLKSKIIPWKARGSTKRLEMLSEVMEEWTTKWPDTYTPPSNDDIAVYVDASTSYEEAEAIAKAVALEPLSKVSAFFFLSWRVTFTYLTYSREYECG